MDDLCLISEVEYDETGVRPVILSFENGVLQPGHEKNLVCRMYKDKKKQLSVAAATDNMIYTGGINRDDLFNTFIAIRDKKKNKMRLVAVDHATLAPSFKAEEDLLNASTEATERTTYELNKQFGSKRVKRQTEQRERMKMDIENVKEQLQQTVSDIKVDVQDMVAPSIDENDYSYKPPINRNTKTLEEVYNLDEIVSPNVLNSLSELASDVLEKEQGDSEYCPFVALQIKKLRMSSNSNKEGICQLLLYIDTLIKFMHVPAKKVSVKKFSACSHSETVHTEIMNKFTTSSDRGRLRPPQMRDKCMCYILVLSMIACSYKLNLEMMAKELKLGLKKLQEVARILAFNVAKEMAILSFPLPAPVSNVRKGKKKK